MSRKSPLVIIAALIFALIVWGLFLPQIEAQVRVSGSLTREHVVEPGEIVEGTITLTNSSEEAYEAEVYVKDFFYDAEDGRNYVEAGEVERSNTPWLSFNPETATVPPEGETSVDYSFELPADAEDREGTYWSMLFVNPQQERETQEPETGEDEIGISIVTGMRYAIQMVTHVGDTGSPQIEITGRQLLQDEKGNNYLVLDLKNTGDRWVRLEIGMELYDDEGLLVEEIEGPSSRLYPDSTRREQIEIEDVEPDTYQAMVLLDGGEDKVWGAQYTLNLEEE